MEEVFRHREAERLAGVWGGGEVGLLYALRWDSSTSNGVHDRYLGVPSVQSCVGNRNIRERGTTYHLVKGGAWGRKTDFRCSARKG